MRARDATSTHLEVGEGSVHGDTPVDETVGAVNDAIIVELDKGLGDGGGKSGAHGEGDAVPVARDSETANLVGDAGLVPAA